MVRCEGRVALQLVKQCKSVETEKVEKRGEVEWVGGG